MLFYPQRHPDLNHFVNSVLLEHFKTIFHHLPWSLWDRLRLFGRPPNIRSGDLSGQTWSHWVLANSEEVQENTIRIYNIHVYVDGKHLREELSDARGWTHSNTNRTMLLSVLFWGQEEQSIKEYQRHHAMFGLYTAGQWVERWVQNYTLKSRYNGWELIIIILVFDSLPLSSSICFNHLSIESIGFPSECHFSSSWLDVICALLSLAFVRLVSIGRPCRLGRLACQVETFTWRWCAYIPCWSELWSRGIPSLVYWSSTAGNP